MNIPDCISPIIAYRVWDWNGSGLVSLNGESWHPGHALEAVCGGSFRGIPGFRHQAPQIDCSCGVYAARNPEQLAGIGFPWRGFSGEVYLWGTVVEHSIGWRAQFAYPKSLVLSSRMIPPGTKEAESLLAALTAYGAEISLANGKANARLWTKCSGYDREGLDALRTVANQPTETGVRVAIFTDKAERATFLQIRVKKAPMAQIELNHVGFPLTATDPIIGQLREQRIGAAFVDVNSQDPEKGIGAIATIRAASDVAIFAVSEMRDPSIIVATMRAGADDCVGCDTGHDIPDHLQLYFARTCLSRLWLGRSAQPRRSTPPGRSSPPGGSTPPIAPVWAPLGRGPRPMRPRDVALALS